MTTSSRVHRVTTGVPNLDAVLGGGLPRGAVTVLAGTPGAGKTILAEQFCFHRAAEGGSALYFNTLSEPAPKTLLYLSQFDFFDAAKVERGIDFVDLGFVLRGKGIAEAGRSLLTHVKRAKPTVVVIDSFKVFDEMARSKKEFRKFGYEIVVQLMAWQTTTLLLGEYPWEQTLHNPLFSIIDGLILMGQRDESGEHQRLLRVVKMRGGNHSRDEHSFEIAKSGVSVFAPKVTLAQSADPALGERCKTNVSRLDDLIREGIPRGSSLLVAGAAGTGKTILLLEFLYRGALAGEKGVYVSFEETDGRLRATGRSLGWDLDREIDEGRIEIVVIPQPDIALERDLALMSDRITALGAKRVAIDSVSVYLHRVTDTRISRDKMFQIAAIVRNAGAVGFLATDIPFGSRQLSHFGVEETVVDGVIRLTSNEEGLERERYIEIYKLRNTTHLKGRHSLVIATEGVRIFPRYAPPLESETHSTPVSAARLPSGVRGLDNLLGGGLMPYSATLLSGSAGIGKTSLGLRFVSEGARHGEPGLFVALEEDGEQVLSEARETDRSAFREDGLVQILHIGRDYGRPNQLLAVLLERIHAQGTKRLVLDSIGDVIRGDARSDALREVITALVGHFRALGVTSVLTLEAHSLFGMESPTERRLSPVADNVVVMRYLADTDGIRPTITVVKTRGSAHEFHSHYLEFDDEGLSVGDRVTGAEALSAASPPPILPRGRRS